MATTTFIKPRLPRGLFILAHDPELSESETIQHDLFDGPYDSREQVTEQDGAIVFLSQGLPYRIGVTAQDGTLLTLNDGGKMRVFPWQDPQTS